MNIVICLLNAQLFIMYNRSGINKNKYPHLIFKKCGGTKQMKVLVILKATRLAGCKLSYAQ